MSIMSPGTPLTPNSFAHPVNGTVESFSGMQGVSPLLIPALLQSSFILFAHTESRYTQQIPLKVSPVQTCYAPDGRSLLYASAGHQLLFMTLDRKTEDSKEEWHLAERETVCLFFESQSLSATAALSLYHPTFFLFQLSLLSQLYLPYSDLLMSRIRLKSGQQPSSIM